MQEDRRVLVTVLAPAAREGTWMWLWHLGKKRESSLTGVALSSEHIGHSLGQPPSRIPEVGGGGKQLVSLGVVLSFAFAGEERRGSLQLGRAQSQVANFCGHDKRMKS